MSSHDQPISDRASASRGTTALLVEQFARIPGQRQLGLQPGDTFVGSVQLVGLHARGPVNDAVIDQRLMLPPKQGGLTNLSFGRDRSHRLARTQPRNDCRRTTAGYIRVM